MPYPEDMVAPMRAELAPCGVEELRDGEAVNRFMTETEGSSLIFFNSVCGCAAGSARPGIAQALQGESRPTRCATVFAGQDLEATATARTFMAEIPPSSPSAALFKDGALVYFLPRHLLEGQQPETVANMFTQAFNEHCS